MNKKDLLRLQDLLGKADDLSAEEKKELKALKAKAESAEVDLDDLEEAIKSADDDDADEDDDDDAKGADDDDDTMTEEDVKNIVIEAVKAANAAAAAESKSAPSAEDVAAAVMARMSKQTKGVTEAQMQKAINEAVKQHVRREPKMQFPDGSGAKNVEFPIEHRSGNLTVAQKQMLNICLMHSSEEALAELKTKRPSSISEGINERMLLSAKQAGENFIQKLRQGGIEGIKTITTGGSGSGAELVYTDLANDLQTKLYLMSDLAAALLRREITMPTDPFKLPIRTARTAYSVGSEAPTPASLAGYFQGSNPTLAQITLDAKKIIGIASYSYEANEDAVVAVLPMLQNDLAEGAAASIESAFINGDTSTTHMDVGASYTATSVETLYDGIRHAGVAVGVKDWSSGGVSKANFMAARASMLKYGTNPRDLLIVADPVGYVKLQAIEEAFRADARGGANIAAVNTGTLPSFNGIPIVVSEQVRYGVASTALHAATGNSYGQLIITNVSRWLVGVKRAFTVEVTSDPRVQSNYIIASFRRAFIQKETASASVPHTVIGTKW